MKGTVFFPSLELIFMFLAVLGNVNGSFKLSHLSTVYLPSAETKGLKFDGDAVEQITYDPVGKLIYAAGSEVFHVIDATDPKNLQLEQSKYEDGVEFHDVEFCGDQVYMTSSNMADESKGFLSVYRRFAKGKEDSLRLLLHEEVGPSPDMVYVMKDCQTAVVLIEGKDYGGTTDPKGQISFVKLQRENDQLKATVTPLGFEAFDDKIEKLEPFGVRFVYRGKNNTFSNDAEPEYITVDRDENKAYVVLQENNAVAEVDLRQRMITSVRGLGYKEWGSLDASNSDNGIRISYWPIRSWYNPDGIKFHQWHDRTLLFTANEGKVKDMSTPVFDESIKGQDIPLSSLGPGIHEMIKTGIQDNTKLGWLSFSKTEGKDQSGKYNNLYTYGGRSFSIWDLTAPGTNQSALLQVFDSGSQLEKMTAKYCPYLFNRDRDTVDATSPEKGPEPVSVSLAELSGRLYIFVGNENPGTIIVFSLGRDVTKPRFETIFCEGIPDSSKSLAQMYRDKEVFGLDPEDLRFYNEDQSPTGRPVLMVAGTVSGSVTLLEVEAKNDCKLDPDSYCSNSAIVSGSILLLCLCLLLHFW